jgi:hypothetical protein
MTATLNLDSNDTRLLKNAMAYVLERNNTHSVETGYNDLLKALDERAEAFKRGEVPAPFEFTEKDTQKLEFIKYAANKYFDHIKSEPDEGDLTINLILLRCIEKAADKKLKDFALEEFQQASGE